MKLKLDTLHYILIVCTLVLLLILALLLIQSPDTTSDTTTNTGPIILGSGNFSNPGSIQSAASGIQSAATVTQAQVKEAGVAQ